MSSASADDPQPRALERWAPTAYSDRPDDVIGDVASIPDPAAWQYGLATERYRTALLAEPLYWVSLEDRSYRAHLGLNQ